MHSYKSHSVSANNPLIANLYRYHTQYIALLPRQSPLFVLLLSISRTLCHARGSIFYPPSRIFFSLLNCITSQDFAGFECLVSRLLSSFTCWKRVSAWNYPSQRYRRVYGGHRQKWLIGSVRGIVIGSDMAAEVACGSARVDGKQQCPIFICPAR